MSGPNSVVITGASTGIGYAAAEHLAGKGWRVFAGVRKDADARRLSDTLGEAVTPVMIDVTDMDSCRAAGETVRTALAGAPLTGLVNNAGVAVAGPLLHLPVEEMTTQLDINVTGQLRVTQVFAPMLGAVRGHTGPRGRIVNISSVAGFSAAPLMAPYACSKHAMEAFTQSLRRELMLYGVDVVAINPGPIKTPIWDKAEQMDPAQYEHTDYAPAVGRILSYMLKRGRDGLEPQVVAHAIHRALTDAKPKLNTVLTPEPFTQWLLGVLPGRMTDKMISGRLGLTPDKL